MFFVVLHSNRIYLHVMLTFDSPHWFDFSLTHTVHIRSIAIKFVEFPEPARKVSEGFRSAIVQTWKK